MQAREPLRTGGLIKRSNRLKAAVEAGVENCMRQTSMVLMEEYGSSMSEEVQAGCRGSITMGRELDSDGYSRH